MGEDIGEAIIWVFVHPFVLFSLLVIFSLAGVLLLLRLNER